MKCGGPRAWELGFRVVGFEISSSGFLKYWGGFNGFVGGYAWG